MAQHRYRWAQRRKPVRDSAAAKLGVYTVSFSDAKDRVLDSGSFRVEAFRLPVLAGTLKAGSGGALVAPAEVPLNLEVHYVSGGGAAGLPVQVSALLRDKYVRFADYDSYVRRAAQAAKGQQRR